MPNVLTRWLERRSNIATPPPELLALFSSGPTESGALVTPQTALSVPAVFSCCQVLSQDVARTPIKLRQKTGPETYIDALDHPLFEILHDLSNPEQTAYQVKHALQWQLLTTGRAYAEIVRVDGRVTALWPLLSAGMSVDRTPAGVKRWTYTAGGQIYTYLFDPSQPPILELVSETPIVRCREIIGTAIALQQYTAKFFANGAKPSGVLTAAGSIKDETAERLRAMWAANYSGSQNRGKVPVLDGGIAFTAISATNDDSQLTETQRIVNEQIAGAFRVPVWKIGDLSKANYSNVTAGELSYVTDSLDPWFELWEEALRRDVLTTRQYGQFSVQFDRSALVRNDVKSLHDSLAVGRNTGYYSANDCRRALGLNPVEGGDEYLVNSALQPVGAPHDPTVA